MPRLSDDDRGLATGLAGFVAILIIAALMFTLLNPAATNVFDDADSFTTDSEAQNVVDERRAIWSNILFAVLLIAALFLLGRAVFESRRPG